VTVERLILVGVPWTFRGMAILALLAACSPWPHVSWGDRVLALATAAWLLWLQRDMPAGGRRP